MSDVFVSDDFVIPLSLVGPGFQLEPLGPEHNERDHEAWSSSIEHILATPGFGGGSWPRPMSLDENLADLVGHARDFQARMGFTYSVLEGGAVIGCLYIYPSETAEYDALVRSWVRESRSDMDVVVWESISEWLAAEWPFENLMYEARKG
jgi:hypothetical protein